jgi:hypothetical protein
MKIYPQHLSTHEIGAYVHRRLRPEALLRIANHLPTCAACCQAVENERVNFEASQAEAEPLDVVGELLSTGTHG